MVVTELPLDDAKRALEALCIPVISPLQVSVCLLRFLVLLILLMIVSPPTFCSTRKLSIKVLKA